jgi:senataxin
MLFDLNELPTEAEEEAAVVLSQPQLPVPNIYPSNLFLQQGVPQTQGILNNYAFKHASSGSGFQPFVRSKVSNNGDTKENLDATAASTSMATVAHHAEPSNQVSQAVEREEGEWSDADCASDTAGSGVSNKEELAGMANIEVKGESLERESAAVKSADVIKDDAAADPSDTEMVDVSKDPLLRAPTGPESTKNSECKGNQSGDDLDQGNKLKDVKGVEASYALKFTNNPAKRPKLDEHKVAMLGKKRARQTVFINVEDAKQAGTMKTITPRRQSSFPAPIVTRTVKEGSRGVGERATEKPSQPVVRDQKQSELIGSERSNSADPSDQNGEPNGDVELGSHGRSKKMNAEEPPSDCYQQSVPRQASSKQPMDPKQFKSRPVSSQRAVLTGQNTADQKTANKRSLVPKRQASGSNTQYNDSSVERLIREVTNDKFWHNPG